MKQYRDIELDNVVRSVRTEADAALANLERNLSGKSTGEMANIYCHNIGQPNPTLGWYYNR